MLCGRKSIGRSRHSGQIAVPNPARGILAGQGARQYPLVNLSEDEGNLYVEALAPGVDPKSLDLSVLQGALTIKGEKPGLARYGGCVPSERARGRTIHAHHRIARGSRCDPCQGGLSERVARGDAAQGCGGETKQIQINVAG